MAGGGILAHPMGPQAGVKALKQAWDAAVEGLTMEEAIAEYPEFAASAQKFSKQ
jgi:ribulose-bisphosphate carboxylase large chain